jgi:uncharacterized NAD-dependent epimerase/dehydratase family protein
MIVYSVGEKIKIKETTSALGVKLEKGMKGIVVYTLPERVEAVFEGLGLVSVGHDLIKKKVRKTERLVKAKNLKLSDEVHIPGSGEYNKIGNIYRNNYDSDETTITVETVEYDSKDYGYNDLVEVRR